MSEASAVDLPIDKPRALKAARWLNDNFGQEMRAAVAGGPFAVKHLCGIICQETAIYWPSWIGRISAEEILARCVFDASGDAEGAPRTAYPTNTAIFRADYGDQFTDMLIAEANAMRVLRKLKPARIVYKGYGIFQYDLQFVRSDEAFFRQKQWYDFNVCLAKAMDELRLKYSPSRGVWDAIRRYNGSGQRAIRYRDNVKIFAAWCAEVVGD